MMKRALKDPLAALKRRDLFWFAVSFANVSLAAVVLPTCAH